MVVAAEIVVEVCEIDVSLVWDVVAVEATGFGDH